MFYEVWIVRCDCRSSLLATHVGDICIPILNSTLHVIRVAVPNVFFHDAGPSAKMRPLAIGDDGKAVPLDELDIDSIHLSSYDQYTWRQLIDGWSCTSCARCTKMFIHSHMHLYRAQSYASHTMLGHANEHAPILLSGEKPEETMMERITDEAIGRVLLAMLVWTFVPLYIEHCT